MDSSEVELCINILQSCADESFDACCAEIRKVCICLCSEEDNFHETWTLGRKQFSSTVLTFFWGKNLSCMWAEVEDGISFNTDGKSSRGNNRCG